MGAVITVLIVLLIRRFLRHLKKRKENLLSKKWIENSSNVRRNTPKQKHTSVRQVLIEYLKDINFKFQLIPEENAIRFGINGLHGNIDCQIKMNEEKQYFILSSNLPVEFSDSKLYQVMETILRLNEYLIFGNFNLSYEYRSIYFSNTIMISENQNKSIIERSFSSHFGTLDDFISLFKNVIDNNEEPLISILEVFKND